jgi:DNA repair exonuclease SbcCD nuclease subunit
MLIQLASDLHTEMIDNYYQVIECPLEPKADVLVLAGDIYSLAKYNQRIQDCFDDISSKFKHVIQIHGNHEYYHSSIDDYESTFKHTNGNHTILNNDSVVIGDVRFLCTTLWTDITDHAADHMYDFRVIAGMTPDIYRNMHYASVDWLETELVKPWDGKTVVVTHHMPSYECVAPQYRASTINSGFATELDFICQHYNIDAWMYGHTHTHQHIKIHNTETYCNPLGYVRADEIDDFKHGFVIEV